MFICVPLVFICVPLVFICVHLCFTCVSFVFHLCGVLDQIQMYDPIGFRPVGTKLILGGLKRGTSKASQNGGPGACPRENFS